DAQHGVADVAVPAEDVGEGVVLDVVRAAPVVAGADDVPLVPARVERRIAGPVVLAVHDVVADLHVLEDLGDRERAGAEHEGHGIDAEGEQEPAGGLGAVRGADDPADVIGVALAEIGDDLLAERVELAAKGVGLGTGQGLAAGDGGRHSSTSERGTEMHSWMSSSGASETAPVWRFCTLPARLRCLQVWQMPMRQPWAGR